MPAHTPGPWQWHSHAPWSVWCGETQIAACRVMEEREGHEGHTHIAPYFETNDDRAEANARLIAAAPRMLQWIKDALENDDDAAHGRRLRHPGIAHRDTGRAILRDVEGQS